MRVIVHIAVPLPRVSAAADMDQLSGTPEEFSVELEAVEGGPAAEWSALQGYSTDWRGASQAFRPDIAVNLLVSGFTIRPEAFYAAFYEADGSPVDTGDPSMPGCNLPAWPADATYTAFLTAAGLRRVFVDPELPL